VAHVAVTAVGVDRPGIVADVTGALLEWGGNLEDTSMTILRGHFSMVLVVAVPDEADAPALEAELVRRAPDLLVTVRPIGEDLPEADDGERWTVSVHGADRPGMVYAVARLLADRGVNVVDLRTRVIGAADRPVYAMLLDVDLPAAVDAAELDAALHELAGRTGIDCTLHPADADIL
jgi:glycine cleavage system transcriptional repressor